MENEKGRIEKGKGIMYLNLLILINGCAMLYYRWIDNVPEATFFAVLLVGFVIIQKLEK